MNCLYLPADGTAAVSSETDSPQIQEQQWEGSKERKNENCHNSLLLLLLKLYRVLLINEYPRPVCHRITSLVVQSSVPLQSRFHECVLMRLVSLNSSVEILLKTFVLGRVSSFSSLWLLGAFAKLRKVTISSVTSVHPSAWKKFGYPWTNFHQLSYLIIFRKSVNIIYLCSGLYNVSPFSCAHLTII